MRAARPMSLSGPRALSLILATAGSPALAQAPDQPGDQPPPAVIVAPVEVEEIADEVDVIGQIALEQVALRARVAGFIEAVLFVGGDWVEAGELLVRIEPEQFEAAVAAAEARLSAAEATFRQAER